MDEFEDTIPLIEAEPVAPTYLARIEGSQVVQVIVGGDIDWATANLGGTWIFCGDVLVGIGWLYDGGEFTAPIFEEEGE